MRVPARLFRGRTSWPIFVNIRAESVQKQLVASAKTTLRIDQWVPVLETDARASDLT